MTQRLKILLHRKNSYQNLSKEFHYKNIHEVPVLKKIVINRGIGDASQNT
jgi:large subunit ribosomal protein L5